MAVEEFSDRLYFLPAGNHYLIVYPDILSLRNICTSFARKQMREQPNSVILFLPFYDPAISVRKSLEDPKEKDSIRVLDIMQVIRSNNYLKIPYTERLRELAEETKKALGDKPLVVVSDMSVFCHINKSSELFEYEEKMHKQPREQRWKDLYFYHKNDFKVMFTDEQKKRLLSYHKEIS